MSKSRMRYVGQPEDWFENGDPIVGELFIKCFVNRYFALPEDWDEDDIPVIMIWVRCITCGHLRECHIHDTKETWCKFMNNRDDTYTSLCDLECLNCIGTISDPELREERAKLVEEDYQYLVTYEKEKIMFFESPIEEYFWKAWRTTFPYISLTPQYPINNYRVDFADIDTKTAIELDGKLFHSTPEQQVKDELRQKEIERQGWRFIRFSGGDIFYHVDRCVIETLCFLCQNDYGLISEAQYQWDPPSARLRRRLEQKYGLYYSRETLFE